MQQQEQRLLSAVRLAVLCAHVCCRQSHSRFGCLQGSIFLCVSAQAALRAHHVMCDPQQQPASHNVATGATMMFGVGGYTLELCKLQRNRRVAAAHTVLVTAAL
jgi:hypothetical protein